jgi:hypothetical protein
MHQPFANTTIENSKPLSDLLLVPFALFDENETVDVPPIVIKLGKPDDGSNMDTSILQFFILECWVPRRSGIYKSSYTSTTLNT